MCKVWCFRHELLYMYQIHLYKENHVLIDSKFFLPNIFLEKDAHPANNKSRRKKKKKTKNNISPYCLGTFRNRVLNLIYIKIRHRVFFSNRGAASGFSFFLVLQV